MDLSLSLSLSLSISLSLYLRNTHLLWLWIRPEPAASGCLRFTFSCLQSLLLNFYLKFYLYLWIDDMRNVFFYKVCVGQNAFFRVQLTAFALSQNGSMKTKLFRFAAITAAARYIHVLFEMIKTARITKIYLAFSVLPTSSSIRKRWIGSRTQIVVNWAKVPPSSCNCPCKIQQTFWRNLRLSFHC